MDLYDDPTVVSQDPGVPAAGPNGPGYFTDGTPGQTPATYIRGWWLTGLGKEIRNVITGAGLTPARATFNQLFQAIQKLIQVATTGAAGGDLTGSYPNPALASIGAPGALSLLTGLTYDAKGRVIGARALSVVVLTTSTNWTPPAGVAQVYVQLIGGGGGGAGGSSSKSGGGGGAGGYAEGPMAVTPGQAISASIGQGGAAGPSGSDGQQGGTTSFGPISASGGGQGLYTASTAGGVSGVGQGGVLNLPGGPGTDGSPNGVTFAGAGGAGYFGGGGRGGSGGGIAGVAPGSGGGGSYNGSGSGGAGANGLIIIRY